MGCDAVSGGNHKAEGEWTRFLRVARHHGHLGTWWQRLRCVTPFEIVRRVHHMFPPLALACKLGFPNAHRRVFHLNGQHMSFRHSDVFHRMRFWPTPSGLSGPHIDHFVLLGRQHEPDMTVTHRVDKVSRVRVHGRGVTRLQTHFKHAHMFVLQQHSINLRSHFHSVLGLWTPDGHHQHQGGTQAEAHPSQGIVHDRFSLSLILRVGPTRRVSRRIGASWPLKPC